MIRNVREFNILDKQRKGRDRSAITTQDDEMFLSELAKKRYSKNSYDSTDGGRASKFFTSPLPQEMAKKSNNFNRFNQPKWYDAYPGKFWIKIDV